MSRTGVSRNFIGQSFSGDRNTSSTRPQHSTSDDVFVSDVPSRKVPAKAASFSIMNRQIDSSSMLPDRSPEAMTLLERQTPRNSYRAAERGKTHLLPIISTPDNNGSIRRNRTVSVNSFSTRRHNSTPPDQLQQMTHSLRSRKRTSVLANTGTDDDMPTFTSQSHSYHQRSVKPTWSDNFGKVDKPPRRRADLALCLARSTMNIKRTNVLQAMITILVTFFVWDSYQKALATTEQLLIVKHEESMMMLHLKRLEEQSLNLHESIARLSEGGFGFQQQQQQQQQQHQQQQQGADNSQDGSESFDGEIIKIQTKQLKEMEDELDHEVKNLQTKIQHSDRENIVRTFGEGPVQVILDLVFPQQTKDSSRISILLWYDTPHAAWTLIEQVNKGLWDDAVFSLDKNVAITVEAPHSETLKKIDFVEKGQKKHEAWTVGLTETTQGGLGLFINLQDNTQYHKHDVCLGKVIDGFDTLQRLTRVARGSEVVTIRKASASHLTRREG